MVPCVSIIVPVYNIEKYLKECLNSIANQTLSDIQVILIDDGSTDQSGKICKDFISVHPNFEYYYKANGGTASARNIGLQHAVGEYIGFVDSDDWIEPDMFEKMYQAARSSNADILYCIMPGLTDYELLEAGIYDQAMIQKEIFPKILPHVVKQGTFRTVDWGNWSRLYRNSLIKENGLSFYEKSRRCEDFAFAVECTLYAKTYTIIDKGELYHYRPNENSKSRGYTKNMWKSIRSLMSYMIQMTSVYEKFDFSQSMNLCVFYFCTQVIRNEMRSPDRKQQKEKIREVLNDELCMNTLKHVNPAPMNKEYQQLHAIMKRQDAGRIVSFLKRTAWKKKHLAPVLNKLFKNQSIKRMYKKIRGYK